MLIQPIRSLRSRFCTRPLVSSLFLRPGNPNSISPSTLPRLSTREMKRPSGAAIVLAACAAAKAASSQCLALPGDPVWPDAAAWDLLNRTVGGRLVATVPLGSVCHDPTYDAAACAALQQAWKRPMTQYVLALLCSYPPSVLCWRG